MKEKYKYILSKINEKKSIIYIVSLCVYLMTVIFSNKVVLSEETKLILKIVRYISIFIIFMKIVICDIKNYNKASIIKISIITLLIIVISLVCNNRLLLQYLIIILGSFKIEFKKIVKYVLITESTVVLCVILFSVLGITSNLTYGRTENEVVRYSLGFSYCTYPSIFIYYLTNLYLYYRNDKMKIYEYIIIILVNIIIYKLTNTRAELVFSLLTIFIVFLYNKNKSIRKITNFCAKYIMIFCTVCSIIFTLCYNPYNEIMSSINDTLSNRLELSQKGLEKFGVKLFGNNIEWFGIYEINQGLFQKNQFNYVDNAYLNILYNYGIIFLMMILYGFYKIVDNEEKKGNGIISCFIIILATHSILNPQILQIIYNIFLLLLCDIIIDEKDEKIEGAENKK